MMLARLSPLGTGTPQLDKFLSGETNLAIEGQHRLTQYFYPNILDDYYPHFTLFNPRPVDDVNSVREQIMATVPELEPMTVDTLCLLVRPASESHYRIHREFLPKHYPQAFSIAGL